jgi:HPt (histidine-containing phosphotransfer) domain-containing protein
MAQNSTTDSHLACLDIPSALAKIGDEEAMRDMLVMLEELLAQDLPKIAAGLQRDDLAQSATLLHSLKGCVPIFCKPSIGDLLTAAEFSAKNGDRETTDSVYRSLGPALDQLAREISQYLNSPA